MQDYLYEVMNKKKGGKKNRGEMEDKNQNSPKRRKKFKTRNANKWLDLPIYCGSEESGSVAHKHTKINETAPRIRANNAKTTCNIFSFQMMFCEKADKRILK
jgi:hypothetical protein